MVSKPSENRTETRPADQGQAAVRTRDREVTSSPPFNVVGMDKRTTLWIWAKGQRCRYGQKGQRCGYGQERTTLWIWAKGQRCGYGQKGQRCGYGQKDRVRTSLYFSMLPNRERLPRIFFGGKINNKGV